MRIPWLFAIGLLLAPALAAGGASLTLAKTEFDPGDSVVVKFNAPDASDGGWVGIIPSSVAHGDESVNDQHDVDYRYLDGQQTGSLSFEAPSRSGSWDLRLSHAGRELASVSFVVRAADLGQVSLRLDQAVMAPGGELHAVFTAPANLPENAWVGVIPASVPADDEAANDSANRGYEYLSGRSSGTMTFAAPAEPGPYQLRMFETDDGGRMIAAVSFEVRRADATGSSITLASTTVLPGDEMQVRFTAPPGFAETAWIGIVPSSVPHGDEEVNDHENLGWEYLAGRRSGAVRLLAPTEPGGYDLRMHDTDSQGREVAFAGFTVRDGVGADDIAARLAERGKLALYGIRFAVDSAEINAESVLALAPVGQLLIRQPDLALVIEGHTDATGSAEHNLELSARRAESVKRHLIDTFGVAPGRLGARGLGQTQPVADNATAAGRALNRRVELVLP